MRSFVLFALLFLLSAPAFAEDGPQRWARIEDASYAQAAGASVENLSTEIYFDPSMLGSSEMLIAGYFFPAMDGDPNNDKRPGTFKATSFRKVEGNTYEAKGEFQSVNGKQPARATFTAAFDKASETPQLVFDGAFTLDMSSHASSQALAGKNAGAVPVNFHFVTEPLVTGPVVTDKDLQ